MYPGYRNHRRARSRDKRLNKQGVVVDTLQQTLDNGEVVSGKLAKFLCYEVISLETDEYSQRRNLTKVKILSMVQQPGDERAHLFVQDTKKSGHAITVFPIYRPTGNQQSITPEAGIELLDSLAIGHPKLTMPENIDVMAKNILFEFFPHLNNLTASE